jgi:hypothetical protein
MLIISILKRTTGRQDVLKKVTEMNPDERNKRSN